MTQLSFAASKPVTCGRFVLETIGFSDAETSLLWSTFRLTGRRAFCYVGADSPEERADIYLVNADHPQALSALRARKAGACAPAVLIGRKPLAAEWPLIVRPIHWMRLFEQLDAQMETALAARARRVPDAMGWDGQTFRRSTDRRTASPVVSIPAPQAESVLVVDDSATVRAFMRSRLAPFRFDVDFAASGEEALDLAQGKHYTCIFLDILMPGMDGYQVCKRLKASRATRSSAVVMLSSKSTAFDKFRGTWAGCDAYLCKPVSEDELLATIARFLPGTRRAREPVLPAHA